MTRQVTALGTNREHGRRQDDECEPGTAAHTQPTGDRTGKAKLSEWRDLVAKSKRVCARVVRVLTAGSALGLSFTRLPVLIRFSVDIITINAASIRRRGTSIVLMRWAGARRSGNGLYSIDDPIPRAIGIHSQHARHPFWCARTGEQRLATARLLPHTRPRQSSSAHYQRMASRRALDDSSTPTPTLVVDDTTKLDGLPAL